jgi:hypothetical protein
MGLAKYCNYHQYLDRPQRPDLPLVNSLRLTGMQDYT